MPDNKNGKSPMEKHFQSFLLTVMTAAVIFGSSQIFTLSVNMATVMVKLDRLSLDSKQYVTMDWAAEKGKSRDMQFADHERRISKMESLLDTMNLKTRPADRRQ